MKSRSYTEKPPKDVSVVFKNGMFEVELNLNPVFHADEECGDYWEMDYAFFHRLPEVIDADDVQKNPQSYLKFIDVPQETQDYYEQQVDKWMDSVVQERKYASIQSCVSYRDSTVPKFRNEGAAAFVWRDRVYTALYTYIDDVLRGEREIPTVEELINELPKIEWSIAEL